MYITDNTNDPAGKFEDLARFAFDNCEKNGDPWNYAAQEVYNFTFIGEVNLEGKRILSTILIILIYKYHTSQIFETLKDIEESIWMATTQDEVNIIILKTIYELEMLEDLP